MENCTCSAVCDPLAVRFLQVSWKEFMLFDHMFDVVLRCRATLLFLLIIMPCIKDCVIRFLCAHQLNPEKMLEVNEMLLRSHSFATAVIWHFKYKKRLNYFSSYENFTFPPLVICQSDTKPKSYIRAFGSIGARRE